MVNEDTIFNAIEAGSTRTDPFEVRKVSLFHNILWSGGCDSTLILWKLINNLKDSETTTIIHAYSVVSHQVGEQKNKLERAARNRFLDFINNKYKKVIVKNIELTVPSECVFHYKCGQAALWISMVLPFIEKDSTLYLGYHRGDDLLTYSIMKDWLKAVVGLLNLYGKHVHIQIPLQYFNKREIIQNLKSVPGLYETTWWCETPTSDGQPCGCCLPCETHKSSILYQDTLFFNTTLCVKEIDQTDAKFDSLIKSAIDTLKEETHEQPSI